jgi:hypothetical protein
MKVDIRYNPSLSLGFISLDGREEVRVEGGCRYVRWRQHRN